MSKLELHPLISVCIPFYNADKYLNYSIASVLNQTYTRWELILLDDGSSDSSLQIAKEYSKKDNRIKVITDGMNKKLPTRLNQLTIESNGSYIARMDADDIMHPERIEKQVRFLENNKSYDLVSSGLVSIDNSNKVRGFRAVTRVYNDFSTIRLGYPVVHPSVMARKSWYDRNQYCESYPRAEDFELWTRAIISNDFKMAVLSDLLLFYREEGNLDLDKIIGSYKDILKIYKKYYSKKGLDISVIKLKLKMVIAKGLYYSGNLQQLASRRNSSLTQGEQTNFQLILDNVINID